MTAARTYDTDYTGRSMDLEVLQGVDKPEGEYSLALSATQRGARAVTGIQKMTQRYALMLLSQLGESKWDPNLGTDFWASVVRGILRDAGVMAALFNRANALTLRAMSAEDLRYPDTPDDEKIEAAVLTNISVDEFAASAYFEVSLSSVAGDRYVYKVPVNIIEVKNGN